MISRKISLSLLLALSASPRLALGGFIQYAELARNVPLTAPHYRDMVRQVFIDGYSVYQQYALGHDVVNPVSQDFSDDRNGWGATIIDSLSTMYVMGLENLFHEGVQYASALDFSQSKTPDTVNVFETSIRYLGGLLSAYELSGRQYPALLAQAQILADKMVFAWANGSDIPCSQIDFHGNVPKQGVSNIAEAGTLTLEWGMLSKYTGNDTYRLLAERSALHIANMGAPLPGLPAQGIDPSTGSSVGSYVTWGGGSDSYFEYLIKYPRFNFDASNVFADSWRAAVDTSISTLLRYSTYGNWTYLADYDPSGTESIRHVGSHLACFHGGNWILGGRLLDNDTIVNYGLQLTDACWNTYASTSTGIGPELWAFTSSDGSYTGSGSNLTLTESTFNAKNGFYITQPNYMMRPEVLESNFYAWRVTGDTKYFGRAVTALQSFIDYLTVSGNETMGYTGLQDVMDEGVRGSLSDGRIDKTESFWFAEVLKYLYLTFDDPANYNLDDYVFNTEAHLFRTPTANWDTVYGSGKPYYPNAPFTTTKGALPQVSGIPGLVSTALGLLNVGA
ncbi:alpha-mannosidase 1 [Coprinopsis cinerea okayama7|uniref:alpha-1,2-Mannosidase n=1 Tax=Coprinopsis cinerea (strain Okayama-7 / 130 / ATCC MYA-4618 / FGSC 9003) TaxID=240176 RepID=A8NC98_COPC7|nr:alpha-mannosidase 1 [Coprinopsis cinerea okayama7\|eukprot:XP_001832442.2 alpha-mannosidase 1 [Coprinopsis cinerea okayama7\